ncbi:MAG: STAS domain-containing protein [Pseudomonadota bacterium]
MIVETDAVTVKLKGELDYSVIETALQTMVEVKKVNTRRYVADLSELTVIDSSGLGVLISMRNASTKHGGTFVIRGARGDVANMLKICRFDVLASIE